MEEKKNKRKSNSKARRIASNTILVCCILIMLFSGYKIFEIVKEYLAGQNSYKEAAKTASTEEFTGNIDFDSLQAINPEIIGWIYLKDTVINYPVAQGTDNDKYLHTLWDGSAAGCGTIFADYRTENPFEQMNTILHGHHMKDGTMFKPLKKFKDKSFADEHSTFEIITPTAKYHLQMVAFLNVAADSSLYQPNPTTDYEKSALVDLINQNAEYTIGVEFSASDKLVMLSTCAYEYDEARYIVVGKLVPWTEDEIKAANK